MTVYDKIRADQSGDVLLQWQYMIKLELTNQVMCYFNDSIWSN